MRNFTIYLVLILCLFVSKMAGQEAFETRAKTIANKIEKITREEKDALKTEVEVVNIQLEKGEITKEVADEKKQKLAEARAAVIELKVTQAAEELKKLVQEKVDGKIVEKDSARTSLIQIGYDKNIFNNNINKGERRTTSQFVFAAGLNNLVTDNSIENSDYKFIGSHFYEWGLTYNTRIAKNNNLLHAKYGLSVMYNNLRPTDNRSFVLNGDQTNLVVNPIHMKESRFRNVYLVVPAHLEFDFSGSTTKDDKTLYKTHQSLRLGIGGYAGINLKSKQIIKYEDDDRKVTERTRGDFNTSNFIYGLSTYVGYKQTSLYLKYDLNPLFTANAVKQNNVSLGVRFDFN
jgi:hypothetical protein